MTPERVSRIYEAVELGMSYRLAAQYGGICQSTFTNWKNRGEAEQAAGTGGDYADFLDGLRAAEARCAARCLGSIQGAAESGSWQAGAWLLERRHDEYRRPRDREEVVMREVRAQEVAAQTAAPEPVSALSPDVLRELVAALPVDVLRSLLAEAEAGE